LPPLLPFPTPLLLPPPLPPELVPPWTEPLLPAVPLPLLPVELTAPVFPAHARPELAARARVLATTTLEDIRNFVSIVHPLLG
jgi:hypothetical protein